MHAEEEEDEIAMGLDQLTYSTPEGGLGLLDAPLGAGTSSVLPTGGHADRLPSIFDEEPAIIDDPVFDVDDDGFLHPAISADFQPDVELPSAEGGQLASEARHGSLAGAEPLLAAEEDELVLNFDDDVIYQDDELIHQTPGPQIPLTPEPDGEAEQQDGRHLSSAQPTEESTEAAEAPQRRVRPAKIIQPDRQTELTNRALNEWNQNYLANMAVALRTKQTHSALAEAKRNAEFWALQQGLGNIATAFGTDREAHPLAIFSGHSLWDLLRGPVQGTKRSRTASVADRQEEEEERRVRAKTSSQQEIAPEEGDGLQPIDEDGVMFPDDDPEIEPEVGRHAPPSLPDRSSGMPWNFSAGGSRHSSALPPGTSLLPRLSSSIRGFPGGTELGPPSGLSRREMRLPSVSPLFGRGLLAGSRLGSQGPLELTSNEDDFADLDAQLGVGLDPDFELYGPSATVDTQTAAQSQWVAATLEQEAYNFLTFVTTKIQDKGGNVDREDEGTEGEAGGLEHEASIMFDELLPPEQNSAVVGAQALLHVLSLTTKGFLEVHQAEPFGNINISVVSH